MDDDFQFLPWQQQFFCKFFSLSKEPILERLCFRGKQTGSHRSGSLCKTGEKKKWRGSNSLWRNPRQKKNNKNSYQTNLPNRVWTEVRSPTRTLAWYPLDWYQAACKLCSSWTQLAYSLVPVLHALASTHIVEHISGCRWNIFQQEVHRRQCLSCLNIVTKQRTRKPDKCLCQ